MLLPLAGVGKRSPVLILAFLAASCGGSAKHAQTAAHASVHGPGFSFEAPAAWSAKRVRTEAVASRDPTGTAPVSATVFTLRKPYSPKLFARAATELQK